MSRSLTVKWVGTLLATSLIGVGLVAIFAYRATSSGFDRLRFSQMETDFALIAGEYYQQNGDWSDFLTWLQETNLPPPRPADPSYALMFALVDDSGTVIVPAGPYRFGDTLSGDILQDAVPVTIDEQTVARLVSARPPDPPDRDEVRYLEGIRSAVTIGAVGAVAVALIVGTLLSQRIMKPLSQLTTAIRAMRGGQLEQRIDIHSRDELGELIDAFNQLSSELHRVQHLRRQMTADIAHELRTPLTVITGYLEGLRNGTLKPTPERLTVLHTEAMHLNRMIEDLRTLSLADAGELKLRREPVQPRTLIERTAAAFEGTAGQQGVTLEVRASESLPSLNVDPERIAQVLANLTSNALRYAPEGSIVTLAAYGANGMVDIRVCDQGPGIPAEKVAHVFERFYRADESRSQQGDESGLGLAIVKSIVEAHGGTIAVESERGQGTTFIIHLPAI